MHCVCFFPFKSQGLQGSYAQNDKQLEGAEQRRAAPCPALPLYTARELGATRENSASGLKQIKMNQNLSPNLNFCRY